MNLVYLLAYKSKETDCKITVVRMCIKKKNLYKFSDTVHKDM